MAHPLSTIHVRNLNATVVNVSNGACFVAHINVTNSSAAVAWVQIFDVAAADVTLGTTRPLFQFAVAATSGLESVSFSPPIKFNTRFSVASTTASEGSSGSADGVMLQAWTE